EANYILKRDPSHVAAYQLLGAAMIGEQKDDQALAAFAKVTELLPDDPSAYVNLALVEISLHHYGDAEQHLKKAVAVDPSSIQAYNDLANFYRLQNRMSEAQQVLQDGIAKNPNGIPLYLDWASILESQNRGEDAEALVDKLRKQMPSSTDATLAIGDFYFQRKQMDRALAEYLRGRSFAPKNLEIDKRMQDVYLSTNQVQPAADLDREVMKSAPKDVIARVNHGRLLMIQRDPREATIYLQRVVADAADSAEAHYYLAMAFWQNGNMQQAHSALLDALKDAEGSPIVLQGIARLSLEQGDAADARIYAQELVQKYPADSADRQLLAEALAREGQLRPAEEQILIAKQLAPNDPIVHLALAQIYSAEKRWPEAEREFDTALQLDPHNTTALGQLADFLTARDQSPLALARVQQYVTANPNDANGHVILGALDFESHNYSASQAQFEQAIQLDPNNVQAYLRLGKVYEAQGQTDAAIARYQKALDLQPRLAPLSTMVGNLYLNKGDLVTARKYFAQALDADPNFAIANANMAWVDAEEDKNLDIALGRAQKAKSLMPESPSVTDTLAWVLYKKGDYAGAAALLQECVKKSPDSAEFRYHLGMTLMAGGQKLEGKQQLETALRMRLGSSEAQQAQQALAQAN
ncbi:MAG: tetratricopeptide repeat protein, partial [Candidatus Acidiferrales bacterium]